MKIMTKLYCDENMNIEQFIEKYSKLEISSEDRDRLFFRICMN